jgi:hypothetical protein
VAPLFWDIFSHQVKLFQNLIVDYYMLSPLMLSQMYSLCVLFNDIHHNVSNMHIFNFFLLRLKGHFLALLGSLKIWLVV